MKITTIAATALLAVAAPLCAAAPASAATNPAPVVFLVPHQDDETLSMGADIAAHLRAGRSVEVYLLTDGSSTGVRDWLGLTRPETTIIRDREFRNALAYQGLASSHVHVVTDPATNARVQDGSMTKAAAERIIDDVKSDVTSRYGAALAAGASWKTMAWTDDHPDHAAIGSALRDDWNANVVSDARFYLKRNNSGNYPATPSDAFPAGDVVMAAGSQEYTAIKAASYTYGIGNLSVPGAFTLLRSDARSRVIAPK